MKRILASVCFVFACSAALADGVNPLLDWNRVQSMTGAEYLDAVRIGHINDRDDSGRTPLHLAARYGTSETVTALIHAGANIEALNQGGWTPLHYAVSGGTSETVTVLINAGANVEARDNYGRTPLHLAARYSTTETVTSLINAGANIEALNQGGWTPLHYAVSGGTSETVTALINAGAAIGAQIKYGDTPLHIAASRETSETVTILIKAGANVEARDNYGYTPLHRAAESGNSKTVTELLSAGANAKVKTNVGKTPFDYAMDNESLKGTDGYWMLNDAQYQPERESTTAPGMDKLVPGLPSVHYSLQIEETSVGKVLYFNGTVAEGFADDVKSRGKFDYFVIEQSDGGLIGEAIEAGTYLRRNDVATSLHGPCASACVELFAGGVKRHHSRNARFGIHAMVVDGDESSLAMTQSVLSARVKYFEAGGVDPKIVLDSLDTPAEEIRWLSINQAKEYGLIE